MSSPPPIREPISDRHGRLTPVWQRFFIMTLQPNLGDSGSLDGIDNVIQPETENSDKLLYSMLSPDDDILNRLDYLEQQIYHTETNDILNRIDNLDKYINSQALDTNLEGRVNVIEEYISTLEDRLTDIEDRLTDIENYIYID